MKGCSIVKLCSVSGISPQAYYKVKQARKRKAIDAQLVVEEVRLKRRKHPRMGTPLQHNAPSTGQLFTRHLRRVIYPFSMSPE